MIEIKDADLLRMQAGDVLVIKYPGALTLEQIKNIEEHARKAVPEYVRLLVLGHGMTYGLVSPDIDER